MNSCDMVFTNEREFEEYIRSLIETHLTSKNKDIFALINKKAVDIIICKNGQTPHLYFIEAKFHINSHGRLGFGSKKGNGFQPEILLKRPHYFEKNLRWVIGAEDTDKIYFLTNETLMKYLSGGSLGEKFNNIQKKIFKVEEGLTEQQFILELKNWIV
jgi:hypothetical protein